MTRSLVVAVSVVVLVACSSTPPAGTDGGSGGGGGGGGGAASACAGKGVGASCGTNAVCNASGVCVGCEEGASCTAADTCRVGALHCATGAPVCTAQGTAPVGTPCSGGVCDAAGACVPCVDGMACDLGEPCSVGAIACNSGAPTCTRARFKDVGAICRPATGPCDAPERCDGATAACPVDQPAADRTPCDDGVFCNGADACQQGQCSGHAGNPCAAPGLCSEAAAACVACQTNADCAARVPQTGCYQTTCMPDGQCSTTVLHDGPSWKVTPVFSPEVQLAQGAAPIQAVFDGQDFLVVMTSGALGAVGRRVNADGGLVDAAPFVLGPAIDDIAFAGDRHLAVSVEPPNGVQQYNYIAGQYFDRQGRAVTPKFPVLVDMGSNCGGAPADLARPRVASNGTQLMVVSSACSVGRGVVVGGASWSLGPSGHTVRYPNVAGRDGGFGVLAEDLFIGMGRTELFGDQVSTAAGTPAAGNVLAPWAVGAGGCCVANYGLAWGNTNWLAAFLRGSGRLQVVSNAMAAVGAPTQVTLGYPSYVDPELGFDGTNFLAVLNATGSGFNAVRVTESGQVLDAPPLVVPASDAGILGSPQLVSTRTGRWLIAYTRSDGNVYARTFSTCP